ncbi:MAG: DUF4361 domain-containing protein [Prevotellaceae bacterium]|nr:DUF4361 domain-containing protein [Prevotellaceae bacterium]
MNLIKQQIIMNQTVKYKTAFFFVLAMLGITCSCNDDDIYKQEQYKNVFMVVSDDDIYNVFSEVFPLGVAESDGYVSASVGGTNSTGKDIKIDFVRDETLLGDYNIGNFDVDASRYARALPEANYKIDDYSLTIPAGQRGGRMKIRVKPNGLSPDSTYLIPLRIQSFTNYEVNPEKSSVLYRVRIKNCYASQDVSTSYAMRGYVSENGAPFVNVQVSKTLTPVSGNRVRMIAGLESVEANNMLASINDKAIVLEITDFGEVNLIPHKNITVEKLSTDDNFPNVFTIEDDGYRTYKTFLLYYRYMLSGSSTWTEVKEELRYEYREKEQPEDETACFTGVARPNMPAVIKSVNSIGDVTLVIWERKNGKACELTYVNSSGQTVTVNAPVGENATILIDYNGDASDMSFVTVAGDLRSLPRRFNGTIEQKPATTVTQITHFGNGTLVGLSDRNGFDFRIEYLNTSDQRVSIVIPVSNKETGNDIRGQILTDFKSDLKYWMIVSGVEINEGTYQDGNIKDVRYTVKAGEINEIKIVDFDCGGEGVSYHDDNKSNDGPNNYRETLGEFNCGVDIEGSTPNIGYTYNGEWVMFTLNVQDAGNYAFDLLVSVNDPNASYSLEVNGEEFPSYSLENNGDWQSYRWYNGTNNIEMPVLNLKQGINTIKFKMVGGGFNIRSFRLAVPELMPPAVAPLALPSITQTAQGLWQFNDATSVGKATVVGQDLIPVGQKVEIKSKSGYKYAYVGRGSYLRCNHGFAASGGGSRVNEYTLMIDFFLLQVTEPKLYYSLLQTKTDNSDDGDLFINPSGAFGVGSYYSANNVATANEWQRYVFVLKVNNSGEKIFRQYRNGVLIKEDNSQTLDSRFALEPAGMLIFADEDGEDNGLFVSSVAVWNRALDPSEIPGL